jgi:DNA-binding CsgD family transcriptional regulator
VGEPGVTHEVWARSVWATVETAARAGLPTHALFEGLPFDGESVRRLKRVRWDDYCVVMERFEGLAGGPESCVRLLEENYDRSFPEVRKAAASLISPALLYRFLVDVFTPIVLPNIIATYENLGDEHLRLAIRLVAGCRPCQTFFNGTIGTIRGAPRHLDLPSAEVVADIGPCHGIYDVRVPRSRTVAARFARLSRRVWPAVLRLVVGANDDGTPISVAVGSFGSEDIDGRIAETTQLWKLTRRQVDVLGLVVRGHSNKRIATELGCAENTVELHLTQLLRRAGVSTRAELTARFWSAA